MESGPGYSFLDNWQVVWIHPVLCSWHHLAPCRQLSAAEQLSVHIGCKTFFGQVARSLHDYFLCNVALKHSTDCSGSETVIRLSSAVNASTGKHALH